MKKINQVFYLIHRVYGNSVQYKNEKNMIGLTFFIFLNAKYKLCLSKMGFSQFFFYLYGNINRIIDMKLDQVK